MRNWEHPFQFNMLKLRLTCIVIEVGSWENAKKEDFQSEKIRLDFTYSWIQRSQQKKKSEYHKIARNEKKSIS